MILLDPEPRLGGPLRFRLELRNAGKEPLLYDDQGMRQDTFSIEGPDGRPLDYIGRIASTFGADQELSL